MEESKSKLSVPVAIVVAGLLVAGAIFFTSNASKQAVKNDPATTTAPIPEITINPITAADHQLGNPEAKLTIVEYSDTECPFCKSYHVTMKHILADYGKDGSVSWVYRHFPLVELHPKAPKEAEATECVAELGGESQFWKYIDTIFEVTPSNNRLETAELPKIAANLGINTSAFNKCLESGKHADKVQKSYEDAATAGGRGTPYSVIILKEPVGKESAALIAQTNSSFLAQLPAGSPDILFVSKDKMRVGVSGAIPEEVLRTVLNSLLKK